MPMVGMRRLALIFLASSWGMDSSTMANTPSFSSVQGVAENFAGLFLQLALDLEAAQLVHRLRGQAQVGQDRDLGVRAGPRSP